MLRVGLTGGIGSGKSTVAGRLAEHGAVVIDADRVAREVVEPGTEGLAAVAAEFGDGVLAADGSLDRAALAERVFAEESARKRLNAIVHPLIGKRTAELVAAATAAAEDAIIVHDVPLLVEGGMAPLYHLAVVVDAPAEQRIARLVGTRGMAEADARARIAAQADDAARRAAADLWLDNSGSADQILAVADALWADRLVPFEANVRLRRYSDRGGPRLVPPDDTWPEQARRLAARVTVAAGERGLRVDHIGSTSVPGLPAKDVLDLQLGVASLADADALAEPLAAAGFPVVSELRTDSPHPADTDPAGWHKRVHCSADPVRWANVHLRVLDSPGWRHPLAFRDWLRANPTERDDYAAMKQQVAATHANRSIREYAQGKETWFDAAHDRLDAWIERTGWTPPPADR
ncbi:MAG TPA: dephospho-CoA kinase [Pseudonocardiaceae bacterium]|jgi:dephospho-CoA kinase|nr:dephospho-CoA kinase [Pseudonocardiaceae bacterium]